MTIDNPLVRNDYTCPACFGVKDKGLLICWPCHRNEGRRYSKRCERLITEREQYLRGLRVRQHCETPEQYDDMANGK